MGGRTIQRYAGIRSRVRATPLRGVAGRRSHPPNTTRFSVQRLGSTSVYAYTVIIEIAIAVAYACIELTICFVFDIPFFTLNK